MYAFRNAAEMRTFRWSVDDFLDIYPCLSVMISSKRILVRTSLAECSMVLHVLSHTLSKHTHL